MTGISSSPGWWSGPWKTMRRASLAGLLLLLMMLGAATLGITSALEAAQWAGLWPSVLLGVLLAWALGGGGLRPHLAWLLIVATGAATALVFGGGLAPRLVRFGLLVGEVAGHAVVDRALEQTTMLRLTSGAQDAVGAAGVIMLRTRVWLLNMLRGQPTFDPVAAAVAWSAVIWMVSAWAGWFGRRRGEGVLASLPALMLAASTLSDADGGTGPLVVALAAALMAGAAIQIDRRQTTWSQDGVRFPASKGRQIGGWAIVLTVGIVAIAAALSSQTLKAMWEDWTEPRATRLAAGGGLGESLGIRSGRTTRDLPEDARNPGLPRERLLTLGPDLAAKPVMSVQLGQALQDVPAGLTVPFYWRSYTYDVYTGSGWRTSATQRYDVPASAAVGAPRSDFQHLLNLIVRTSDEELTVIHSDGDLNSIDHPAILEQRGPGDQFGGLISPTRQYEVQSIVTVVPADELRRASSGYPDPISARFLQLPADVPDRVRRLAIELTSAESTPYDRAWAIEAYLRAIPYSLDVPRAPLGQDVVDYFLFDAQSGYCDYYASAMVVLSRIAGIPSRLAVGYASGEFSEKTGRFLVHEADAHSWAELYFPGVGWVPFEPTAARAPIDRALADDSPSDLQPDELQVLETSKGNGSRRKWPLPMLAAALVGAAGLWLAFDEIRLRRSGLANAAGPIYTQLRSYAVRLGAAVDESQTPYELGESLSVVIQQLPENASGPAHEDRRMEHQLAVVVDGLVLAYYQPDGRRKAGAGSNVPRTWAKLRWRLRREWLARLLADWVRPLGRSVGAFLAGYRSDPDRGPEEIS